MEDNKKTEEPISNIQTEENVQDKVLRVLESNLEINQETLKSVKFLKNYFYWKTIFGCIKWVVIILVIILGFISLKPLVSYMESYVGDLKNYSNKIESVSSQINGLTGSTKLK